MCRAFFKYALFAVNLIFTLIGIALIILGIIIQFNWDTIWIIDEPTYLDIVPYVFIVLGISVALIAFFGCCGSIAEIKCFLIFYAILMAFFAATKVFAAIILLIHKSEVSDTVEVFLQDSFENIETDRYFHGIEALLKCCGTSGPGSYNETFSDIDIPIEGSYDISELLQQGYLPPTCCRNPTEETRCMMDEAFQNGCTTLILDKLDEIVRILSIILISFATYEAVAMLTAIYMSCTSPPKKLRYVYG